MLGYRAFDNFCFDDTNLSLFITLNNRKNKMGLWYGLKAFWGALKNVS